MASLRVAVLVTLALASGLTSGANAASPAEDKVLAKQHFESGARHFDLSEYDQALAEFKEAYRLKPDAPFLYNIAQCHRKLGHVDEALTFYKTYLRRAPDAPNRGEVERRIQELEAEHQAQQARKAEEEREAKEARAAKAAAEAKATAEAKAAAEAESAKTAERAATVPPPVETPSPQPAYAPLSRPVPEAVAWPASPVPANRTDLTQAAASKPVGEAGAETSILHRWWFWTAVGVVVVGGVTAAVLATRRGGNGVFCSDCATTAGLNLP
jgi:hypothetical protein